MDARQLASIRARQIVKHVPRVEVQEIVKHVPKIEVQVQESPPVWAQPTPPPGVRAQQAHSLPPGCLPTPGPLKPCTISIRRYGTVFSCCPRLAQWKTAVVHGLAEAGDPPHLCRYLFKLYDSSDLPSVQEIGIVQQSIRRCLLHVSAARSLAHCHRAPLCNNTGREGACVR